jgi:hypothetical protein
MGSGVLGVDGDGELDMEGNDDRELDREGDVWTAGDNDLEAPVRHDHGRGWSRAGEEKGSDVDATSKPLPRLLPSRLSRSHLLPSRPRPRPRLLPICCSRAM